MKKKQNQDPIPAEITESNSTDVEEIPNQYTQTSPKLTGSDVDAVGDEAVGGSSPTPDQSVTAELAAAVGMEIDDTAFLRTNEMLEQRDAQRWELEPKSSEDYSDREK